jgi:hypothetical protein
MLTVIFKKLKHVLQAAMYEDTDCDDEYYFSDIKDTENSVLLDIWTTIFNLFLSDPRD